MLLSFSSVLEWLGGGGKQPSALWAKENEMRYVIFALLFLLASCSVQYVVKRNNWQGSTYVVDTRSVDSLRQMFRDAGHSVFDWDQYRAGRVEELNKVCVLRIGKTSAFIGDIDLKSGNLLRFCTILTLYDPPLLSAVCRDIGLRAGKKGSLKWADTHAMKFACILEPFRGRPA